MFGEEEELVNTDISIHDSYTNIPYQEEQKEDNGNDIEVRNTSSSVPKISLGNVFLLGRRKMIEMKIPLVRKRKENRVNIS